MLIFNYEVREAFTPLPLNGDIRAKNKQAAVEELIEFYAYELNTEPCEVKLTIWEVI